MTQFKSDLCTSELLRNTPSHFDDLVNTYNYTTLSALLDKHPPLRLRSVVLTCTDKTHVYLAGPWGGGVRRVRSTPPPPPTGPSGSLFWLTSD